MANPYTSVAVASYNADPPSDDGSATSNNQLTWAKHKTKLADPLKTAIESINSNVNTAFALIFGQTITTKAANYTITTADQGAFLTATAALTFTLPVAGTAGEGFAIAIANIGSGLVTIDGASSETINGDTSIYIGPGESAMLTCDSSSWAAVVAGNFPNREQSKSGNYTVAASDVRSIIEFTATATATLLAAASAGAGFVVGIVNRSTALVTIDGASSETINGSTSLALYPNGSAILYCDGSGWGALVHDNGVQRKVKTADESVTSSITLQDDDHLAGFVLEAGADYEWHAFLPLGAGVTEEAQFDLQFSNAAQDESVWLTGNDGTTDYVNANRGTSAIGLSLSNAFNGVVILQGVFTANASTGGTVDLQWAQTVSGGNATTIYDGATMTVRKVS